MNIAYTIRVFKKMMPYDLINAWILPTAFPCFAEIININAAG